MEESGTLIWIVIFEFNFTKWNSILTIFVTWLLNIYKNINQYFARMPLKKTEILKFWYMIQRHSLKAQVIIFPYILYSF